MIYYKTKLSLQKPPFKKTRTSKEKRDEDTTTKMNDK